MILRHIFDAVLKTVARGGESFLSSLCPHNISIHAAPSVELTGLALISEGPLEIDHIGI